MTCPKDCKPEFPDCGCHYTIDDDGIHFCSLHRAAADQVRVNKNLNAELLKKDAVIVNLSAEVLLTACSGEHPGLCPGFHEQTLSGLRAVTAAFRRASK